MLVQIRKVLGVAIFLLALVFFALSDAGKIIESALKYSPELLFFALILGILELLLQTIRIYLFLDEKVNLWLNAELYVAGQFLSFLAPSRFIGEALKPFLYKKYGGTTYTEAFSAIVVERFQDFLALLFFLFLSTFWIGQKYFLVSAAIFLPALGFAFAFFHSQRVQRFLIKISPGPTKQFAEEMAIHGSRIVRNRPLFLFTFAVTLILWIVDFVRFYLLLSAVGGSIPFATLVGITVIAYLATVFSFLPGGLLFFEGSSIGLFTLFGVPFEAALVATLVERFYSYWMWLIIGAYYAGKYPIVWEELKRERANLDHE